MVSSALAAMALLLLGTAMAAAPLPPAVPDDQYTVEVCPNAEWKVGACLLPGGVAGAPSHARPGACRARAALHF